MRTSKKDTKTTDIFSFPDHSEYGESEPVIAYNKSLNRKHTPQSVCFADGYGVFHHME